MTAFNQMTIREGRPDDAGAMARIYNHYVETSPVIFSEKTLTAEEMRVKLRRLGVGDRFPFAIAETDGVVAGYAYAHYWQPDPVYSLTWELTMYLAPEACGKGIGTAMLARLIDECRRGGAHSLISCVSEGNTACETMHTRAGFSLVARIPEVGFKFGRFHNDLIYQLVLD